MSPVLSTDRTDTSELWCQGHLKVKIKGYPNKTFTAADLHKARALMQFYGSVLWSGPCVARDVASKMR